LLIGYDITCGVSECAVNKVFADNILIVFPVEASAAVAVYCYKRSFVVCFHRCWTEQRRFFGVWHSCVEVDLTTIRVVVNGSSSHHSVWIEWHWQDVHGTKIRRTPDNSVWIHSFVFIWL